MLLILSVVTFAIIQAPPGDYADYIRSQLMNQGGASFEQAEAQAQAYRIEHGLDKPLVIQYFNWIGGIVTRGDFGYSFYYNKPVADVVGERLPRTIVLALVCHIFASVLGIAFGIWAATRQYSWVDNLLSTVAFLGMTIPRFLMALILVYLMVFHFDVSEIGSFFSPQYGGAPWSWGKFVDLVSHVWPVVAIAVFGGLAYNMRVMRGNLLDTLNAQYVETARAKGLSEGAVIMRHAVPNAVHPLVMYQGVVLPLHAERRDRNRDHLRAADRRPGHCRLHGGGRCLCHRNLHDGAGRHADRRQHHRRHAARHARPTRPRIREGLR